MSARLIDDVLVMILDELAFPAHTPNKYRTRQEALRNVCLASRRLRRLAQPRLWRQVVVRSRRQLERLVSAAPGPPGRHTRFLTVVGSSSLSLHEAVARSSILPNVVEIRVTSSEPFAEFDFCSVDQYFDLRRLHLEKVELRGGSESYMHALEELSLHEAKVSPAWLKDQLEDARLPRLRALYVVNVSSYLRSVPLWLDELVSPDFFGQLDVLQTDILSMSAGSELAQSHRPPVLIFGHEFGQPRPLPSHAICGPRFFDSPNLAAISLSALDTRLRLTPSAPSPTTPPRLLILPPILRRIVDTRPPVAQHLRIVEALCVEKGVRIMWDDEQEDGEFISPAFRRYARELRDARALEG